MIGMHEMGFHHLDVAGIQGRTGDYPLPILLQTKRGKDRLKHRRCPIIQRSIDRFKTGELSHHALVDPLRDQRTLTALRLIRSIGGRKLPVR
ncbi:MAG: hypothetical protein BWY82_02381 [Verrucomicrobia bacterium ADurb.Bin474]|nr:MAG: hypothetical protein BWY82_02381 [Verrucomicrobia bacterium ADurb.Bin474]